MTTISRAFSITYGSVTVGAGSSIYTIEGPITRSHAYMMDTFTCMVIVSGSTRDVFLANVEALRAALARPRRDLTVTLSSTVMPFTEGTNATSISASMSREPSRFDTSTSQTYTLTFDVQKTASDDDDVGLVDYNYSTTVGQNSVRSISVGAVFTQHNGSTAEARYNALFPTILTTIKNSVSDTAEWEEGPRSVDFDRFNQTLSVTTSFVERIYGENAAGTYESALKSMTFNSMITYLRSPGAIRDDSNANNVAVSMSAVIDKAVTQDLQAVYETVIKPKILAYVNQVSVAGFHPPQPTKEDITLDPVANTVSGSLIFRVYGSLVVLRSSIDIGYSYRPPAQKVYTYDTNGFSKLRLPGPGSATCMIERSVTVLGDRDIARTILATLDEVPTKTKFGGPVSAAGNFHMDRQTYNDLGITGGGWTKEGEDEVVNGPIFNDILGTQLFETTMMITTNWDYDVEPQGLTGISLTR